MIEIIPNWHPIFVHFTVALFSLSVGLFVVTPYMKPPLRDHWLIVARWALWFGVGFTIITGFTGLYAYNTVAHDTPSHAAMTEHRNWAIATITLFFFLAAWSVNHVKRKQMHGAVFAIAMLIAGGLLGTTAWHGGEAVYRFGLGVMSLPKVEGEGHAHEHADGAGHGDADKTPMGDGAMDMTKKPKGEDADHDSTPHAHDDAPADKSDTGHHDNKAPAADDHPDDGHDH